MRTASGIAVVAVMSKPHRCPHIATTGARTDARGGPASNHGSATDNTPEPAAHIVLRACAGNICIYCPGGPDSDFEYSTQARVLSSAAAQDPTQAAHRHPAHNVLPCHACRGALPLPRTAELHGLRAHQHARHPGAVRPVRAGARARGPAAQARPLGGQGARVCARGRRGAARGAQGGRRIASQPHARQASVTRALAGSGADARVPDGVLHGALPCSNLPRLGWMVGWLRACRWSSS